MDPWIIEVAIVAASLGAWFSLYVLMLAATRPRPIRALPATPELGTEPPAVVSLVCGDWVLNEDAAESTLLDLGVRKIVEFRQPADDPLQTTVHIRQSDPVGLTAYGRRVLDRVAGLAVGGVVPLTALTFRDQKRYRDWWKRLRAEVVADARSRGLSRRRFSPAVVAALVAAAALVTAGVAFGVVHYALRHRPTGTEDDPMDMVIPAAIFTFFGLATFGARYVGERDTSAGREVAARWLGVRAWLRAREGFADLPPASVGVWDRYLGYGAALGITRVASAVVDMGMGDRKRLWSSYGRTWHRVRVRYPRVTARYGTLARTFARGAVLALGGGYVLFRWWRPVIDKVAAMDLLDGNPIRDWADLVQSVGFLGGVMLLAFGAYRLIRVLVDLAAPVTVTGQVLWMQVCRKTSGGEDSPPVPILYHIVIDDGRADRITAWALPASLASRCDTGDTVTVTARRWTRRILQIQLKERGSLGYGVGGGANDVEADALHTAMVGTAAKGLANAFTGPPVAAGGLLTSDEVARALGRPVALMDLRTVSGMGIVQFTTTNRKRVVLTLQVVDGTMGSLAWRMNSRGAALPGVGDGAWMKGNRAVARVADTTVVLTLVRRGRERTRHIPWLLERATSRIAAGVALAGDP